MDGCLPCANLDGTLLSMVFCLAVLNACHIDSTFLSMFLCGVFKIAKSSFILYMSTFFTRIFSFVLALVLMVYMPYLVGRYRRRCFL